MKQLMIHVEKIVRPIRGGASTKMRMRRELLGHLQECFDEEKALGLDDAAALAAATRRLGEPAALLAELQGSIPRLERRAATPFPAWMMKAFVTVGVLLPIILAAIVMPAGNRTMFVSGIIVVELDALLWYRFTIRFFRPRIRWSSVLPFGVAAMVTQFAWAVLISEGLTGHAVPEHPVGVVLKGLMLPAYFGSAGIVAIVAQRRRTELNEWRDLELSDM